MQFYRPEEVDLMLRLEDGSTAAMIARGQLHAIRLPNGETRVPADALAQVSTMCRPSDVPTPVRTSPPSLRGRFVMMIAGDGRKKPVPIDPDLAAEIQRRATGGRK